MCSIAKQSADINKILNKGYIILKSGFRKGIDYIEPMVLPTRKFVFLKVVCGQMTKYTFGDLFRFNDSLFLK